jgi:hypothetical protein
VPRGEAPPQREALRYECTINASLQGSLKTSRLSCKFQMPPAFKISIAPRIVFGYAGLESEEYYVRTPRKCSIGCGLILLALTVCCAVPASANTMVVAANLGPGPYTEGSYLVQGNPKPGANVAESYAVSFTPKVSTTLEDVKLPLSALSGPPSLTVGIASDDSGRPGSVLATLTQDGTIPSSPASALVSFTCTTCPVLEAGTPYWVVTGAPSGDTFLAWSLSTSELGSFDFSQTANVTGPWSQGGATYNTPAFQVDGVPQTGTNSQPLRLIPMLPCRVVDTRDATKPPGFGRPSLSGGATRSFPMPNGPCGIPATAQAYSLNVTVVPDGDLGYITVWPTGQSQPLASTLNSLDGEVKANAAIVAAGTGGAISVFATNETDVVLDVNGYFVPNTVPNGLGFYPMTPCRLVDTRPNPPFPSIVTGALAGGTSTSLPIPSSRCNVPATAQAYSLNFTLVPPKPVAYLTAYPTGESVPIVSTLNDPTGSVEANAAIAPAGVGGNIDVFVTQTTDLVVDINGYFAPVAEGALSLYTLPPCRVLDTRTPGGAPPFVGTIYVDVIGSGCGGTTATQAYVFNATVVPQGSLGYLTLWPEGSVQPVVSTLNAYDGEITSNMAIVPTNNNEMSAFATNNTYLILDLFGYFAP